MAKYCANCNKLTENDEARFCSACGSSQFVPVQPAAPQSAPVMPQFNSIPAAKPKRKVSFGKIALIAIPVILIAAILLNITSIIGFATKLFGSDKSYFKYVEEQSVTDTVDTFSAFYGKYLLDDALKDNSYNVKFTVKLGDDLKESIKSGYAENLDINWLDDTAFDMTLNVNGKKVADELLISIGGQHVLTTSALADLQSNKMYLKLKEITDDVLIFNLSSEKDDSELLDSLTGENKEFAAAVLPEASVAKDILTKYHGIIIDKIENVTRSKEEVKAGDISEELTVLKAEISEKTLKDISLAVLEELKKDSQIKSIIENAENELKKNGSADKGEISYSQFLAEIDEGIKEITAEEAKEDTVLVVYDYVNSSDELVGRKIGENGEVLDYVTVKSGNKFATRGSFEGSAEIVGAGTVNGNRETSEYTLSEDGKVLYKIALTDFDKKAFESGVIDGKIRLFPNSKAIKAAAPSKYKDIAGMLDIAVEIDGKGDSKSGSFKLTSYNGEKPLFTADAKYSVSGSKNVSEPSGKKLEIKSLDSLQALLGDLHLDPFVANLRKTTVPKDYVDAIEEISKQLKK